MSAGRPGLRLPARSVNDSALAGLRVTRSITCDTVMPRRIMALITFASDFTGRMTLNCCKSELIV